MPSSQKLIHISDLHYGQAGGTTANANVVNAIVNREDIADCTVIITGDVVDDPGETIYRTATSALRQLSERCGKLIMAPGNHDLCHLGVHPHHLGQKRWGDHVHILTGGPAIYPRMVEIGGVAIITVDTNRRPPGVRQVEQSFSATGYIGDDQIERVAHMVASTKIPTVIAMHHCPSGGSPLLRLYDRRELGEALESVGGVDLMLTGHLHQKCEWSDVFGARYLLSSPKTPSAQGYRVIWWEEEIGRFRWGWVDLNAG